MPSKDNGKMYALISGICFAIYGIYVVWQNVNVAVRYDSYKITWLNIVWWIVNLGLAVLMFIRKKNIGFLVLTGAGALMYGYYLIRFFSDNEITVLTCFIGYALFFVVFFLNVIPSMQKNGGITKVLCFLPAATYFAGVYYYVVPVQVFYIHVISSQGCSNVVCRFMA